MKRFAIYSLLLISSLTTACCRLPDYLFYIKVDSGISFADSVHVCAPNPPWDVAVQGYNATLGKAPIVGLNIGCELAHALDLEFSISNRSIFKYRKCQTPVNGGASYKRTYDLDVTSVLFSAYLLGRGFTCLNRDIACGRIYPLIGFGLGASNLLITNYRTTCLPPSGDSSPYASFSAENQYTLRRKCTYTFFAGVEYNHADRWAIATGYRLFNAGHFKGPRYQRVANGSAVDVACDTWKMRLRSNEWFVEFKIFI